MESFNFSKSTATSENNSCQHTPEQLRHHFNELVSETTKAAGILARETLPFDGDDKELAQYVSMLEDINCIAEKMRIEFTGTDDRETLDAVIAAYTGLIAAVHEALEVKAWQERIAQLQMRYPNEVISMPKLKDRYSIVDHDDAYKTFKMLIHEWPVDNSGFDDLCLVA